MTSVWPALWPPWKRTTTSARSESQSTILPLPSSPHWAPITATFAMTEKTFREADSVDREDCRTLEAVAAIEAACLGGGIARALESRHRHPARAAQALRRRRIGAGGKKEAPRRRLRRQRAQDGVGIEREAGRGLALAVPRAVAPAAPELAPHAARVESKADPRVILEAAVLHGIDGDRKTRQRRPKPV